MASVSAWERIERRKLRQRERWTRPARPGDRPDPSRPAGTDMLPQIKPAKDGLDHTGSRPLGLPRRKGADDSREAAPATR